jgi:serine/threonine-protein kinase
MPPTRIGRCAVFGELAAGGMATVYVGRLAGAAGFARRVAIKSLHAQYAKDPDFLAMFLDEARLSGRIQHPNVVRVLDVISSENELHLVMEYIEGESLSKLVRLLHARGERLPLAISVAILIGILDGLHAAHEARSEDGQALEIVHRDVSPQNVLVGSDGLPRILDFGIAKAVGRMQTTRGDQLKGKLAYMAPEHLAHEALDRRGDVYAAGILLWELLTGERLFHAGDEISTFRRALEAKVATPSSIRPELPAALDQIVLRALAKSPSDRYQTARDFSYELEKSGLGASVRDVSVWVQATAHESLSERSARIAEYEAARDDSRVYSPASDVEGSPSAVLPRAFSDRLRAEHTETAMLKSPVDVRRAPGKKRNLLIPLLSLLFLLVTVALGVGRFWPAPSRDLAAEPLPASAPPAVAELKAAAPSEMPAVVLPEPAEALTALPSSPPPARLAPARPVAKSGARPRQRSGCETPFTVDAHGIRVPKLECL